MKSKIILTFLLLIAVVYSSSAVVIIISGGKNNKYNYVYLSQTKCVCKGTGSNSCPVDFSNVSGHASPVYHPLGVLVEYVKGQVEAGNVTGSYNYADEFPTTWRMSDKENIEITIDDKYINDFKTDATQK